MIIEPSPFDGRIEVKIANLFNETVPEQSRDRGDVMEYGMVTLNQLKAGQTGDVVELRGGAGFVRRLEGLGIRLGCKVTKVSSMLLRGPVTVRIGQGQVAIGFGMANKIIVKPEEID